MIRAAMAVAIVSVATLNAAPVMAGPYDSMISTHAAANGVPESLVRRVIVRESRYRPEVISKGNYGMMQIKLPTARSMGYSGDARGLLDANTNLTYAVKYLAGAYRAAHGNHDLAVSYYARGYYYAAKAQGWNANAPSSSARLKPTLVSTSAADGNPSLFSIGERKQTRAERREARHAARLAAKNNTIPLFQGSETTQPPGARAGKNTVVNPFGNLFAPAKGGRNS
jgi:hypothetical protein